MKLKGLGKRSYNVMFHTHTVAGITICFALFIIFYAGAFALFRYELLPWEDPYYRVPYQENHSLDAALKEIDAAFEINWEEDVYLEIPDEHNQSVSVWAQSTDTTSNRIYAAINSQAELKDIEEPSTTVAQTLYDLHFFNQIPIIGLIIAGFVSLFYLFSIINGLLIHWHNLLNKLYAFVKEGKWKAIWTNAHTVFGVIGLPFHLMYAVTGALFGLLVLFLLPMSQVLDEDAVHRAEAAIDPYLDLELKENPQHANHLSIDELYRKIKAEYPDYHFKSVQLRHYGKEDALAAWFIDNHHGVTGRGSLVMFMRDGEVLEEYSSPPDDKTYSRAVYDYFHTLHFGSYGGLALELLYFVLSMISCFMIITGVLIWRTARDNGNYTLSQRIFHHQVTKWYLAICLSLFPAVAILFLTNKLIPMELVDRTFWVNTAFFVSWLILTTIGLSWNKYAQQNKNYLILGGALSVIIPVVNGITTGDWIWSAWNMYPWVAYVDVFWAITGLTSLYVAVFILKVKPTSDFPIDLKATSEIERKSSSRPVRRPFLKPQLSIDSNTDLKNI
ncbi:MAG: PepSY-associated TM helix domain-containing protein [Bacteroidota bacterium]